MPRNVSFALLLLGYCLIRCASPSLAKPAHAMATISDDIFSEECTSTKGPCEFLICPGDIFRAVCDQFSLVNTDSHPIELKDVRANSTCCMGKDCSHLKDESNCNVPNTEVVSLLKQATSCFKSPNCIIKHPEMLLKLEEKFCNMTMKMLTGFYYCN